MDYDPDAKTAAQLKEEADWDAHQAEDKKIKEDQKNIIRAAHKEHDLLHHNPNNPKKHAVGNN